MLPSLAYRMVRTVDARLLWKFSYNFGFKGMLSVQRFKRELKKGKVFPPFLYISIINSCNLRCQGCWVDVAAPQAMISFEDLNRLVVNAKKHGNTFFGILGGEPFMHPDLIRLLEAHPDCYFQIFTNGHFITDEVAAKLRRAGNAGARQHRGSGNRKRYSPRTQARAQSHRQWSPGLHAKSYYHRRRHQRVPEQF